MAGSDADSALGSDFSEADVYTDIDYDCIVRYDDCGRTYQGLHAQYPYPADERENNLQHDLYALYMALDRHWPDKSYESLLCRNPEQTILLSQLPPIGNTPNRCLDLGAGSGKWAEAFADVFRDCQVIGRDTSNMFSEWVPPNLQFELASIEDWWSDDTYDFIHAQDIAARIDNWPGLLANMHEHLEPEGWVQIWGIDLEVQSDPDGKIDEDIDSFNKMLQSGMTQQGRVLGFRTPLLLMSLMDAAGFGNIKCSVMRVPAGGWHHDPELRQLGESFADIVETRLESASISHLTKWNGESSAQVRMCLQRVHRALSRDNTGFFQKAYNVTGQKMRQISA